MRVLIGLLLFAAAAVPASAAARASDASTGRIGPDSRIQPSGRKLDPVGAITDLGNLPRGGALTPNGRFYWALDAGEAANDIRIVRLGRSGKPAKVVQTIQMPGVSGGVALAPDGKTAYVSGLPASDDSDARVPAGVPGQAGDVIHVFKYRRNGRAKRAGLIDVPPPFGTPAPQTFPPTTLKSRSWPQELAISPDGGTLLVALNLADSAAVINTSTKGVRYVRTGAYPYGAAITGDGRTGLISNEGAGTVSAIELGSGRLLRTIGVGANNSHPEAIVVDPTRPRAYVSVTNEDAIAVLDTADLSLERRLSVKRPEGIGAAPVGLGVTGDGCRLVSADSGEDALAVFSISAEPRCDRYGDARADSLVGKIPVAAYPVAATPTPNGKGLVWLSSKGFGSGPSTRRPGQHGLPDNGLVPGGAPARYRYNYLPAHTFGSLGTTRLPGDSRIKRLTRDATRQVRPVNRRQPPGTTPLRSGGPIEHVFYVVRENRTYDQILGDDPRGDGKANLALFGKRITPNAHALARRFPLLDHVYANSEASIDGHFWTSASSVSDYVVHNWHQNYAGRGRPYDFGVYSITWPAGGFLFDQAEDQGISYFNYGEAIAGVVPLTDKTRSAADTARVATKFARSDIGPFNPGSALPAPTLCYPNDASIGINAVTGTTVFDSTIPKGANPLTSESRIGCFRSRFAQQLATDSVPAFNYLVLSNDHTLGTSPGRFTPRAMVADNDYALGQLVDTISHSKIWGASMILVVEDDSQDGADHLDAHRIPALAISPWARRSAVVHTRYDFPSFARTLGLPLGLRPNNLFVAQATPLYDAFDGEPADNAEPFSALPPSVDLLEKNTSASPAAKLSERLSLEHTDETPQRILDKILWKSVHGADATPPPPGPNASGLDEAEFEAEGVPAPSSLP